jgi:hypothetical protein
MAAAFPAPAPASEPQARLRAAKQRHRQLREARETRRLEHANNLMESLGDGCGGYGGMGGAPWAFDYYAMLDKFSQQFIGATNVNDRRWGRNWPIFITEIDLNVARMPSRLLNASNVYAIGLLQGWVSYIMGEGFVKQIQSRPDKDVPKPLLSKLQEVIDEFARRNDWEGAEQPGLEQEFIQRAEIDGETGLCLSEDDAGLTWATTFEPEQLTAPPGADPDYMFGVLTEKGNPQRPLKYWLRGWSTDLHGTQYDASQIVHFKQNVQRQVKRGWPTFSFSMSDTLTLANDLRQSLGAGAKFQASIAGVRQWDNSTPAEVTNFTQATADYLKNLPGGQTVPVTVSRPGGIEDVPKGMQWVNPPSAENGLAHIQILHACLRAASVRLNAPDWLGSGDASANTYDNSVATGSTFGRRILREQARYKNTFHRIFWWALDTRCTRQGEISAVGPDGQVYRMAWEELKKLVELKITPASVEERDKKEEAERITLLVEKELMSPQQGIVELGEDVEETMAEIKAWREEMGPPAEILPDPSAGTGNSGSGSGGGGNGTEQRESLQDDLSDTIVRRLWDRLAAHPDDHAAMKRLAAEITRRTDLKRLGQMT